MKTIHLTAQAARSARESFKTCPLFPSFVKGNVPQTVHVTRVILSMPDWKPFMDVLESGGEVRYRLPDQLMGWAELVISQQLLEGVELFPCDVELGLAGKRSYAEFVL